MGADAFHAQVRELFAPLGEVTVRRMFGGAGVYCQGVMFALLADEIVYLKADAELERDFSACGSGPFIWAPQNRPKAGRKVQMSYWRLPDSALDDPEEASQWGARALAVALQAAAGKPARGKRR